jgi:alpha-glucosidase
MRTFATLIGLVSLVHAATAQSPGLPRHRITSPDGEAEVRIEVGAVVTYAVTHRGHPLLDASAISLVLEDGRVLGRDARVRSANVREVGDSARPVVPTKNAVVPDHFRELRLRFEGGYGLEFRAYDHGVAYRWVLTLPQDSVTIVSEQATFGVAHAAEALVGLDSTFITHYEPVYQRIRVDSLRQDLLGLLPLLVTPPGGPRVVITESGLESYPGMYLAGGGPGAALAGVFPQVALEERATNDRDVPVTRRAPYIARVAGRRALPWRIVMIANEDRELLDNQLVYLLAPASRVDDVSWIRPGKVSWDWWNALNVRGVPFRAGVNDSTYRFFIDFAARYGIPYVILDEGWYTLGDLLTQAPGIDVAALASYGRERNVGLVLWASWHTLERQMPAALDQFQRWGVRGIKVDFMQRDDQRVVEFYWRVAREAAARRLVVDFHGAHKPAGLDRAYPNVLTFEGVRGLENSKWSATVTPEHDVTLPFTRMLAGPMDFTPGAMINAQPANFRPVFERPMSQGTRAHQLAMYVVYESPLQMLADAPSEYLREPESMEFLAAVPVTWDETRVLAARVADYVVIARRQGAEWYVGAMTDTTARELTVDLSFLGEGDWTLDAWADGVNADRDGRDFRRESQPVTRASWLVLRLAPGGGYAARIRRAGAH